MAKSSVTSLGTRSSDLVHSSSNSPVSGALCGYFWACPQGQGSNPICHPELFPDRNALPAQMRNCFRTGCPVVKETSYFFCPRNAPKKRVHRTTSVLISTVPWDSH